MGKQGHMGWYFKEPHLVGNHIAFLEEGILWSMELHSVCTNTVLSTQSKVEILIGTQSGRKTETSLTQRTEQLGWV